MKEEDETPVDHDIEEFIRLYALLFMLQFMAEIGAYFLAPGDFAPYSGAQIIFSFVFTSLLPDIMLILLLFDKKHVVILSVITSALVIASGLYILFILAPPLKVQLIPINSFSSSIYDAEQLTLAFLSGAGALSYFYLAFLISQRMTYIIEHREDKKKK